jgi:hypothetical protein
MMTCAPHVDIASQSRGRGRRQTLTAMLVFVKLGSFRAALGLPPTVEYVRLLADANDAEAVWPPSIHFPEVMVGSAF